MDGLEVASGVADRAVLARSLPALEFRQRAMDR